MFSNIYEEIITILSLNDKKCDRYLKKIKRLNFDIKYLINKNYCKINIIS